MSAVCGLQCGGNHDESGEGVPPAGRSPRAPSLTLCDTKTVYAARSRAVNGTATRAANAEILEANSRGDADPISKDWIPSLWLSECATARLPNSHPRARHGVRPGRLLRAPRRRFAPTPSIKFLPDPFSMLVPSLTVP
jgi:hypothetical protein